MSSSVLEIWYEQEWFVGWPGVSSKHQGDHSETLDEAHNPSGYSVEKHSNNFVVSNVVEF